ncbi:hypothetical protein TeGR_g12028, partial [Tetraparma gracilis]
MLLLNLLTLSLAAPAAAFSFVPSPLAARPASLLRSEPAVKKSTAT